MTDLFRLGGSLPTREYILNLWLKAWRGLDSRDPRPS